MGQLKKNLLFFGLSSSAYISPTLMFLSLFTNYWLHSIETVVVLTSKDRPTTTTSTSSTGSYFTLNSTKFIAAKNSTMKLFLPLDHIEAMYGLWEMCKIIDTSGIPYCETIKHFRGGSDSEVRLTDILKRQIGICIVPILAALVLMAFSVLLHTYACLKNKMPHLFLISGCIFIFAGLASLTGLIVFIAAVNGAVDSQLTASQISEEPPFVYRYGLSFFCAILSFLMQEFNGICNVYWYVGHYNKYRYDLNKFMKQNDLNLRPTKSTNIPTLTSNENLSKIIQKNNPNEINKIGFGSDNSIILNMRYPTHQAKIDTDCNLPKERFNVSKISNKNFEYSIQNNVNYNSSIIKNELDTNREKHLIKTKNQQNKFNPSGFIKKSYDHTKKDINELSESLDFPSIKYIIDDGFTVPLTLNIFPKSSLIKNSLPKSKISDSNLSSNDIIKGSTNNILLTISQSTSPRISSVTSATSQDESSLPHSIITNTLSSLNTSTSSPESSVTESASSNENKKIAQLNMKNQKIGKRLNQFNNEKIDFESLDDIDDMKAKFYKILKLNDDSCKNFKSLNKLDSKYSKSFDENYYCCLNDYKNKILNEKTDLANLNNHDVCLNNMDILYKYSDPLQINKLSKHEQIQQHHNNYKVEHHSKSKKRVESEDYKKNILTNNVSQKSSFQYPKRTYSTVSNKRNVLNKMMNQSVKVNNNERELTKKNMQQYYEKGGNFFTNYENLFKNSDEVTNSDLMKFNRNSLKKSIENNFFFNSHRNTNLIENKYDKYKICNFVPNEPKLKFDQNSNNTQFFGHKLESKIKQESNKSNKNKEMFKQFLDNTVKKNNTIVLNIKKEIDDFSEFYNYPQTNQMLHMININPNQTGFLNIEPKAQYLRKNMKRTTSV